MVLLENPSTPILATALIAICASSVFYTWIWFKPNGFKNLIAPADPCQSMAFWANVIKAVQYTSIIALTDLPLVFSRLASLKYGAAGVGFILAGQILNFSVYRALGIDGVYYGFRFGKNIPWVDGFPYSHFRDPQYVGCILSLIGSYILGFPQELCLWWFCNYLYLMWLESRDVSK